MFCLGKIVLIVSFMSSINTTLYARSSVVILLSIGVNQIFVYSGFFKALVATPLIEARAWISLLNEAIHPAVHTVPCRPFLVLYICICIVTGKCVLKIWCYIRTWMTCCYHEEIFSSASSRFPRNRKSLRCELMLSLNCDMH